MPRTAPPTTGSVVLVLAAHRPELIDGSFVQCLCSDDAYLGRGRPYAEHLAAALAAAAADEGRLSYITPNHLRVLVLVAEARGAGVTDTQLARRWAVKVARARSPWPLISDAGLRSRRAELVAFNLVEAVPDVRGRTLANRPCKLWRIATGVAAHVPTFDEDTRAALEELRDEAGEDVVTRAVLSLAASAQAAK